ncbi:MAG: hypothetical protein H3C47_10695 [Candidatus Cloacimonetes bacterium]|nr:hypothetical protein [Candidatus Cloacimonadota bacterium]
MTKQFLLLFFFLFHSLVFSEDQAPSFESLSQNTVVESVANSAPLSQTFTRTKMKCESDDMGHKFFSELVTHEEPAARLWAATFLYLSDPANAIAEFQALIKLNSPHISGHAYMNLKDIERGVYKITFDQG